MMKQRASIAAIASMTMARPAPSHPATPGAATMLAAAAAPPAAMISALLLSTNAFDKTAESSNFVPDLDGSDPPALLSAKVRKACANGPLSVLDQKRPRDPLLVVVVPIPMIIVIRAGNRHHGAGGRIQEHFGRFAFLMTIEV